MAYVKKTKPVVIAAAFIAFGLAVCLTVASVFSHLAKRPGLVVTDDSDLIPTRIEIPAVSNAFWTLERATNELYWPASLDRKLRDLSDGTNWDDSLAAEVLEKNRAYLNLVETAMQQPGLLVPEPKTPDEDYSYLDDWEAISLVESIRVFAFIHAKKDKDAFNTTLEIIRLGHRVEDSGGPIIPYLVGSSIKVRGLWLIQRMVAQTSLSEADLSRVIRELDNYRPNGEGLTNALKVEYQMQCKYINDFAAGKISSTNSNEQVVTSIGIKPLFNVAKTRRKFAQADRTIRDNISKSFGKIDWSGLPLVETNRSVWRHLIRGNAVGDIFFELLAPPLKGFCSRKCREDVNVTATQLLLALKIYKTRHGKLPESLSASVPEFFSQIPIDDFSGQPFRYLLDKKLIYSVGPDLKDSGGVDVHENRKSYDLPFKIEF